MSGKFAGVRVSFHRFVALATFHTLRTLAALAAFVVVLALVPREAQAAGSFKMKTTQANEVSGAWHVFVTIELPRPPAIAHVPVKFLFTKETVFERALVDNHDGPVTNRMVLTNQTPNVESLDVDFADGSGKIFKGTRFDFSLTRTRGYEAGEYKVQLRTSDGTDIGGAQHVTLNGENPVVDRRSITFNAKEKSIKKVDAYGADGGSPNGPPKNDDDTPVQSQEVAPSGSATPFIPTSAYEKTPEEEIKTKPGGCGCETVGHGHDHDHGGGGAGALALGLGLALGASARSRRRRTAASATRAG